MEFSVLGPISPRETKKALIILSSLVISMNPAVAVVVVFPVVVVVASGGVAVGSRVLLVMLYCLRMDAGSSCST